MGRRGLAFFLAILLLCVSSLSVYANPDTLQRQLEEGQRKLNRIQEEIREKQQDLKEAKRRKFTLLGELSRLQRQLEDAEKGLRQIEARLSLTETRVRQTQGELEEAERQLERRTMLLGKRLRALYENGAVSYLEVLLSATDFGDFVSRFELLRTMVALDVDLFKKTREFRVRVAEKKIELEAQRDALLALREEGEKKRVSIQSMARAKEKTLQQIQNDIGSYERALDEYLEQSRAIEKLIRETRDKLRRQIEGVSFIWPIEGRITSSFGNRFHPILKKWRLHTGIDVGAPIGAPVKAMEDGKVIYSGWMGGYGKVVIIDHGVLRSSGASISTLYAHNSELLVSAGQQVKRGQLVARVGSTGLSTGPHAHFEVRINGTPVNPLDWLNK